MIALQPQLDIRPIKVEWYWQDRKPQQDDGKLQEVYPFFVLNELVNTYTWEGVEW